MTESGPKESNYVWTPRSGLCPVIVNAGQIVGECLKQREAFLSTCWLLDYEFLYYNHLCRIGGRRAPWLSRPPRVLHLYPPNTPFWEDTRRAHGECHSCWITLNGGIEAGLNGYIHPPHAYARFEDPANRLGAILLRMFEMGQRQGEAGFWECQALLNQTIGLLGQAYRIKDETYRLEPEGVHPPITLTSRVEDLLLVNLAKPLSMSEIAGQLHLSKPALYHRMRAESKETISQMYQRLRINEAKRLLLHGCMLKEIADRTGFCNAFYLSAAFKRIEGVSPREFKKLMK